MGTFFNVHPLEYLKTNLKTKPILVCETIFCGKLRDLFIYLFIGFTFIKTLPNILTTLF